MRQAILDTGAPAFILSTSLWTRLHAHGDIAWVSHPPTTTARKDLPVIAVLHGRYPFRLGSLRVELADLDGGRLTPREVLVICTEDVPAIPTDPPELPRSLIIGLVGVLNGRSMTLQVSEDGRRWAATILEP